MSQDLRPIYSIGAVARLLGVTPATLRTWEDRYGVISPKRSQGGRRLYSRDEVDRLQFIKTKIEEGLQPADAHRLLADQTAAVDRPERKRSGGGRSLILIAERDPFAADLAEYFLRTDGYEVEVAGDTADAERLFAALSPQLAIVDLLLSRGEGLGLCRRLKERGDVPVLAVSVLETRDAALAAGADAFLQKPLDPLVLTSTVRGLLGFSAFAEADVGARP